MRIDILLSTYNSETFLEKLVESMYSQSYSDWRFIIRDDCSSDNTVGILRRYQKKDPERFHIIENDEINIGPKRSFEKLLEKSSSDYMMFCDHDDYWLSHKIEQSIKKIKEIENRAPNKAALVFTDLTITDQDLNIKHQSFWQHSKINPSNIYNIYKLINNNPVVGCTVIMNKKAKSIALPISDHAMMHDWWIALKVAENGVIEYIKEPSILYRQHKRNEIGVERASLSYFLNRFLGFSKTMKQNIDAYKMLKALNRKYSGLKMIAFKFEVLFMKIFT